MNYDELVAVCRYITSKENTQKNMVLNVAETTNSTCMEVWEYKMASMPPGNMPQP